MTTPSDEKPKSPVSLDDFLDTLEFKFRGVTGRTLLGEVTLTEMQADDLASVVQKVICRYGKNKGIGLLIDKCPFVLAIWLVNEAFFHFSSGAYWPPVLERIGLKNDLNHSLRLGRAFVDFLQKRSLPRFRRLKTRLSYVGPILAHAGIPRSCLPEFFEKVLPRAEELGAADDEVGFDQLLVIVPHLYLSKSTERFLLFGEEIARDFLKRSIELRRFWLTDGTVPAAPIIGLPERVVDAFKQWTTRSGQSRSVVPVNRRSFARPILRLDVMHGLVIELPSQSLESGETLLTWLLDPSNGSSVKIDAKRELGERVTVGQEVFLPEPFALLKIRLLSANSELATWAFDGILRNKPMLFFGGEDFRMIPFRQLKAGLTGIVHPPGWRLSGYIESTELEPPVSASLGTLPFGWGELEARIYDLTDLDRLDLLTPDSQSVLTIELAEAETFRPRLRSSSGRVESARDVDMVFFGSAPSLEIWKAPHQPKEEFLKSWVIELRATTGFDNRPAHRVVQLRDIQDHLYEIDGSAYYQLPTKCEELLGNQPWGQFELIARGPIGQDARFSFRVLPEVKLTHDWSEWSANPEKTNVTIRIPPGVRLTGAHATADPREYLLETHGQSIRLYLELEGYQKRHVEIPLDVQVFLPAWAIYTPHSGRPLINWSRKHLSLSADELGDSDVILFGKLATPWGIPSRVTMCLSGPTGDLRREPVEVDRLGNCKFELRPFIADARQHKLARIDLIFELELSRKVRLSCGTMHQRWSPDSFSCDIHGTTVVFSWNERLPVQNRAIRVDSLLTPWDDPRMLKIPDATGCVWEIACNEAWDAPGLYRATLGLEDLWNNKFEAAPDACKTIEVDSISEWNGRPVYNDPGPDGYLFRTLLQHYTNLPLSEGLPEVLSTEYGQRLVTRVLKTYAGATLGDRASRLRAKLDGVLRHLPVEHLLGALADNAGAVDPKLILGARLFARGWSRLKSAEASVGLTDLQMEDLWRGWKPLAVWADLQLLSDADAERRLVQHLGKEELQLLSPVQPGAGLSVWWDAFDKPVRTRIQEVISEHDFSPFHIKRVESGVTLMAIGEYPSEIDGSQLTVSRDELGRWVFFNPSSNAFLTTMIEAITSGQNTLRVGSFFPKALPLLSNSPESAVIELVRRGHHSVLRSIRAHCSQLPNSPINLDAFQEACFEWCIRAASDLVYREELRNLCAKWVIPIGDELSSRNYTGDNPAQWRALRELKNRWDTDAAGEPLYAVNFLVWIVALALIWRGMGRIAPLQIRENELGDLSLRIFELTPALFEHDLLKLCAIEAVDRASEE